MTPDEYCQEKAAKSGSSFYYAFLFLPPERRRAITALYAFCREVDDVVDEATDPSVARVKLAWWRTQVDQLFAGRPDHPVMRALTTHLAPYGITPERLHAVIDGMDMELDQTRYLDWPGLRKYCWHAAGVVGELSAGGIWPHRSAHARICRKTGSCLSNDQYHPRHWRRRTAWAYLPTG